MLTAYSSLSFTPIHGSELWGQRITGEWGGQLLVSIIHDIIAKQTTGRVGRGSGAAPI